LSGRAVHTPEPSAEDYLSLFRPYCDASGAFDFGRVYLEPADERYRLLFEQVCHLLVKHSDYNLAMPQEFRRTARSYLAGDAAVLAHMRVPQMRHFMLSDFYDYVHLSHRLGHGFA
jgi:hypothetical protein